MVTSVKEYESSLPLSRNFSPISLQGTILTIGEGTATAEAGASITIPSTAHFLPAEPWYVYFDVDAGTVSVSTQASPPAGNVVLLFRGQDQFSYEDVRSWTSHDANFVGQVIVTLDDLISDLNPAMNWQFEETAAPISGDGGFWDVAIPLYTNSEDGSGTAPTYGVVTPTGTGIQYNNGISHGDQSTIANAYNGLGPEFTVSDIGTIFMIFSANTTGASVDFLMDVEEGSDDEGFNIQVLGDGRLRTEAHRGSGSMSMTTASVADGGPNVTDGNFHTLVWQKIIEATDAATQSVPEMWRVWIDGVRVDNDPNVTLFDNSPSFVFPKNQWWNNAAGNSAYRQFWGRRRLFSDRNLDGVIDRFVYWDDLLLTDAQVVQLHELVGI